MKLLISCCFTGCFYVDNQKGEGAGRSHFGKWTSVFQKSWLQPYYRAQLVITGHVHSKHRPPPKDNIDTVAAICLPTL